MKRTYGAIFEREAAGGYSVWVPDLPGCASQGDTIDEARANIREAVALYLDADEDRIDIEEADRALREMAESGEKPIPWADAKKMLRR